jgi:hypothetical protein
MGGVQGTEENSGRASLILPRRICRASLFHPATVWKVLKRRFNYSLKVFARIAAQRDRVKRELFMIRLHDFVWNSSHVAIYFGSYSYFGGRLHVFKSDIHRKADKQ